MEHLRIHLDETLSFHPHADEAAAQGLKCLLGLRHNNRGLSTFTALHLIKTALLPEVLWGSPVWWTGSQHVLHRQEPIHYQELHWALGLPKCVANRKLFLMARMPPLQCLLNYLSAPYAVRLMFVASDHPLQQYIDLTSRTIRQPWLAMLKGRLLKMEVRYPTLPIPLSLAARIMQVGDVFEQLSRESPAPLPPFLVTIQQATDASEGQDKHREFLQQFDPGLILLYTDGSELDNQNCGSAWAIFPQDDPDGSNTTQLNSKTVINLFTKLKQHNLNYLQETNLILHHLHIQIKVFYLSLILKIVRGIFRKVLKRCYL